MPPKKSSAAGPAQPPTDDGGTSAQRPGVQTRFSSKKRPSKGHGIVSNADESGAQQATAGGSATKKLRPDPDNDEEVKGQVSHPVIIVSTAI